MAKTIEVPIRRLAAEGHLSDRDKQSVLEAAATILERDAIKGEPVGAALAALRTRASFYAAAPEPDTAEPDTAEPDECETAAPAEDGETAETGGDEEDVACGFGALGPFALPMSLAASIRPRVPNTVVNIETINIYLGDED